MARQQIGWVARSGEYFTGTPQEREAQELATAQRVNPYLPGGVSFEEIRQRQQEESRLIGLATRRIKGLGVGYPGQPGYIAPTRVSMQQQRLNRLEFEEWWRLRAGYGGVGGYVAPGQYVPPITSLSFMGDTGRTTAFTTQAPTAPSPTPQQPEQVGLLKFTTPTVPTPPPTPVRTTPEPTQIPTMGTFTPPTITPPTQPTYQPTPIPTMTQPTPIAPTPQPTPTPSISFTPATPQQPTYQRAPTQTYQSSYYQTNGYKPYSYQGDTFGDKPFAYAYQRPRLQQSYTGI